MRGSMFSDEDLHKLQQIIFEDYQKRLSLDEVRKIASKLVGVYSILVQPKINIKHDEKTRSHLATK